MRTLSLFEVQYSCKRKDHPKASWRTTLRVWVLASTIERAIIVASSNEAEIEVQVHQVIRRGADILVDPETGVRL